MKTKTIHVSDEVAEEYSTLDNLVYLKCGKHLTWDGYIRMSNLNMQLHESLNPIVKQIGVDYYGRKQQ
jgi:hypothetical protein